jgi:hypothetical protein
MLSVFTFLTAMFTFVNSAEAGRCWGAAGCFNLDCNYSVECESAGCSGCSSGRRPKFGRATLRFQPSSVVDSTADAVSSVNPVDSTVGNDGAKPVAAPANAGCPSGV